MKILNTPIKINKTILNNRLVMPPMATAKANEDGTVSDELCKYYAEKSQGGYIGLIITEHCYINKAGKASNGQMSIADECNIEGLKSLTSVIHNNKTIVLCQLNHAGGATAPAITGKDMVSASAIVLPKTKDPNVVPREMTQEDINEVIRDFVSSALRAKEGGYDGIEIHSAHGYLLNQFYSPLTNKRKDSYGGDIEGRIKLHLQIIKAIREEAGSDFIIALRLGACDYIEGGSTIEDAIYASKRFEEAGIDLLDISGGFCGYMRNDEKRPGWFSNDSSLIKKAVKIPVILTGGIENACEAEELLDNEKADLIGVGRALLKDSLWAKRAMTCNK